MTDTQEKKPTKRKKQGAYKPESRLGSFGSISDAFSELESLGSECREIVDNAEGGLSETQRIQTFGETADTLEGLSEPDVPDGLGDEQIDYTEQVNRNKKRGPSRAVRRDNAVAVLQAAAERARSIADDERDAAEAWEDASEEEREAQGLTEPSYTVEQCDAADTFASELDDIVSEVEGVEFPGMFG